MKSIGIVVLSHKNVKDTVECIQSLQTIKLDNYQIRIVLVDNSEDNSFLSKITEECRNIDSSIECPNNGYSAGNNVGIKRAISIGCEYIVVINNDTVVDNAFLKPLISMLEKNKKCIVAPIIYNYYSNKIWSSGGKFRKALGDYCMLYDDFNNVRKTEFISGCCFATSACLFNEIGLLDENYFMYCEDNEFCKRVTKNGFSMYVLKDSVIYHKVGASTKGYSEFQLYYIYRNRIYFCYSFFRGLYKAYAVFINKLRARLKAVLFFLQNKRNLSKALNYAIKDGKDIKNIRRY